MATFLAAQPAYSAAAAKTLQRKPVLLIDGAWRAPLSDAVIDVVDPSTERKISQIVDASEADRDAAVSAARRAFDDTEYGLAASVWTKDLSVMHKVAAKIKAGTVWGNCHLITDYAFPFGGFKQSGIGRENSRMGIDGDTETKTVMIAL